MSARIFLVLRKDFRLYRVQGPMAVGIGLPLSLAYSLEWVACWTLTVLVIQQESLVGDRPYWLARPIAWQELLAAKALFILIFVNLPIWLSRPLPFSEPAAITVFLILPAAAFAAVTRNLGQAVLAFIGAIFAFGILSKPGVDRRAVSAAALSITVILLQYSCRRELLARSILLAGIATLLVLWRF